MLRYGFVLLLLLTGLWSCQESTFNEQASRVEGTITPPIAGYVTISMGTVLDSAKIDKNGHFSLSFLPDTKGSGIFLLNQKFTSLYLEPGKSLSLTIDASGFPEEIEFSGDLAPINNYLRLADKLDQKTAVSGEELFSLEPNKFIALADSLRDLKIQLLKEYALRYPEIDPEFIIRNKADIVYSWATQRLSYPGYYATVSRQIPALHPEYYTDFLSQIDLNNPELLISTIYKGFLEDYLDFKQTSYIDENPSVRNLWFPESVARFRVIQQEFTDTIVRDYVLFASMNDHLDNFGKSNVETFLTHFELNCSNPDYLNSIHAKLDLLSNIDRGKPAPVFTAYNADDKPFSQDDFRESLVYINLWATWSTGSLQEFPYWEKLIREFDSRNVSFVSISMDFAKDTDTWKYILKEKNLQGIHLIQDPRSDVWTEKYLVKDLPRYLLIDKEGNIISSHAPRPSENMQQVLERLLKE